MDKFQKLYESIIRENDNIYTTKYHKETVDKPIISDAIKIISKNKKAVKFDDVNKLKEFKDKQRYFSASESKVYQSIDDYKNNKADKKSYLLFETGREIVVAWDDKQKIGYVIPK